LLNILAEQAAAMSDEEVAIRWYVQGRINRDQRSAAIFNLPPREAWPRLAEQEQEVEAIRSRIHSGDMEFAPAAAYVSGWMLKRKIQALRIIEAVRHHLAKRGKLPEKLADIEGLSIPLDPLTDLPFEWSVTGNTATLKGPPLPAEAPSSQRDPKRTFLEYRLVVK
jgi:hypothetical protein